MKRVLSLILVLVLSLSLEMTAAADNWYDYLNDPVPMTALLPEHPESPVLEDIWSTYLSRQFWLDECENDWPWSQSYQSVFEEIKSLAFTLTSGQSTETEKVRAIYQWVSDNIEYSFDAIMGSPMHTFYQKRGICSTYSELTYLMLILSGFPAACISGVDRSGGGHGWNAAYADGRWIHFDATQHVWDMAPDYHKKIDLITFQDGPFECDIYSPSSIRIRSASGYKTGRVTIPAYVTAVSEIYVSFVDCTDLVYIDVDQNNPYYTSIDGVVFSKDRSTIVAYPFGRQTPSYTIPDGTKTVGRYAFGYLEHSNLTSVTIPEGVTQIDEGAFIMCGELECVTIPGSVTQIGQMAFYDCPNLTIYGQAGSYAQKYAAQNGIPFVAGQAPGSSNLEKEDRIPASGTAYASTQTVTVDGAPVEFQMYALKDAAGNETNYIKLRDLAYVLNSTPARFSVGYDGTISITSGQPYAVTGAEMTTPYSGDRSYTGGAQSVRVNGSAAELTAITLLDENGGGYTYFKLRDLGEVLGFTVDWSAQAGVFVNTDRS